MWAQTCRDLSVSGITFTSMSSSVIQGYFSMSYPGKRYLPGFLAVHQSLLELFPSDSLIQQILLRLSEPCGERDPKL